MSSVEPLVCPHCGADLDVPDGVSVLRCKYCGSKLQLKETGSVRALALIEKGLGVIGDNTGRTADGVEKLHEEMLRTKRGAIEQWQSRMRPLRAKITRFEGELGQLALSVRRHERAKSISIVLILLAVFLSVFAVYFWAQAPDVRPDVAAGPWRRQQEEERRVAINKGNAFAISAGVVFLLGALQLAWKTSRLQSNQSKIEELQAELSRTAAEHEQWRLREPL